MTAYTQIRRLAIPLLAFSMVSNLATLVSPLFMMQVLDRVIPSGNTSTLLFLGLLALGALLLQSLVEAARDNSLGRLSRWAERYGTQVALTSSKAPQTTIDQVAAFSGFLTSQAAIAAINLPWVPLVFLVLFLVHPAFLAVLLAMLVCSAGGRVIATLFVRADEAAAATLSRSEHLCLNNASRFEAQTGVSIIAHHLRQRFVGFQQRRHGHLDNRQAALTLSQGVAGFIRSSGQILALGVGAYLVTIDQISAGGMIAGSILLAKGYATVESAITQLPTIQEAASTYRALCTLPTDARPPTTKITDLKGALRAENLTIPRGGGAAPRLERAGFSLGAGECLVIVGSSGSGKTSLLQALSGQDPAPIGSVFLDESEVKGLSPWDRYRLIGYLPQQADLVGGSVAENICGFDPQRDDDKVVQAAMAAGVHGLISALPDSYDTDLTNQMYLLSAGQRQRVALARALYNSPRYLFLDEPNALLDGDGEKAMAHTLFRLKDSGTTIVMILHRSGMMGLADKVLRLERGRVADFGPRAEVLGRLGIGGRRLDVPVLETSEQDIRDWVTGQFTRSTDDVFAQKAQVVAAELLNLACQNGPRDVPRIASFNFTFIDDTRCEISMTEAVRSEIETRVAEVRAKLREPDVIHSSLSRDEAAIARITKESEAFKVRSFDEAIQMSVALKCDVPPVLHPQERLN